MSDALVVRDDARLSFSYTEAANAMKESALAVGALVGRVSNAEENQIAVNAQGEISRMIAVAEKARVAAKEPILNFGRLIDAQAKQFVEDLKAELLRIAQLTADFQQLEQARVRAAEQARLAEQRKLEDERRMAEQAALREAAIAKQKLDDEAKAVALAASKAKTEEAKKAAEAQRLEVERQQALAVAKSHEELDRINHRHAEQVAELPVAQVQRAVGQRVREDWEITVTDIWLLAKAHPTCVDIKERLSEIKTLLNAGVKVAGVLAKRSIKAGVTTARERPAIEV